VINRRDLFRAVITIFLLTSFGCAVGSIAEHQEKKSKGKSSQSWFDPLALGDDDIIINGLPMPSFNNEIEDTTDIDFEAMTEGYRVQIYTTQELNEADSILAWADSLFLGEAYLRFDAPNYKIRVGNLTSRSEAEELQNYTRKAGFPRSWVLRTNVFVNPRKKEIQPPEPEEESEQ